MCRDPQANCGTKETSVFQNFQFKGENDRLTYFEQSETFSRRLGFLFTTFETTLWSSSSSFFRLFCRFLLLCHLEEHANEKIYRTRLDHLLNKILKSSLPKRPILFIVSRCFVCWACLAGRSCRWSRLFLYFHMYLWNESELWFLFCFFNWMICKLFGKRIICWETLGNHFTDIKVILNWFIYFFNTKRAKRIYFISWINLKMANLLFKSFNRVNAL